MLKIQFLHSKSDFITPKCSERLAALAEGYNTKKEIEYLFQLCRRTNKDETRGVSVSFPVLQESKQW